MDSKLSSYVELLERRYADYLERSSPGHPRRAAAQECRSSLAFAAAVLRKAALVREHPEHPRQIVVLGPTQVGKSTLVNWVLGEALAATSPLAGYTVHPQGFALGLADSSLPWLDAFFHGFRRVRQDELAREHIDCFALVQSLQSASPLAPAVLWDTPDFDSVHSEDYRESVLCTAALADIAVLVVSKEKYADRSVWTLLKLLAPLQLPMTVCLNKTPPDAEPAVLSAFARKWSESFEHPVPELFVIPWLEAGERLPAARIEALRALIGDIAWEPARRAHDAHARRLLEEHWDAWHEPIRAEQRTQEEWIAVVRDALNGAVVAYRKEFLEHPQHYETFQRALAELLGLLEFPGLAGALVAARRIVTWPARQLAKLARQSMRQNAGGEADLLQQLGEQTVLRLEQEILSRRESAAQGDEWWRETALQFRKERARLLAAFHEACERYRRAFEPEIERTARQLYEHLETHPAVLASLRATRLGADAAALAVALHTGGIGIQDFVLAPATLSLTSLLAESALGHFMDRAQAELKQRQGAAVDALFQEDFGTLLMALPSRSEGPHPFRVEAEQVAAMTALLEAGDE